jgi:TetR/AcrR family transcriptional repressor of mexJK operon
VRATGGLRNPIAITEAMIGRAVAAQAAAIPGPDTILADGLFDHALTQLQPASNRPLMQLRRVAIAKAERFPQVGPTVFEAGPARVVARLGRVFAAWHKAGRPNTPDPDRTAALFNWLIMGGPTSEAMLLGAPRFQAPDAAKVHARECVRVFLAAYGRD